MRHHGAHILDMGYTSDKTIPVYTRLVNQVVIPIFSWDNLFGIDKEIRNGGHLDEDRQYRGIYEAKQSKKS